MSRFTPKSLLGDSLRAEITRTIKRRAETFLEKSDPHLTENDFIQAFIQREHVPHLMKTQELCGPISRDDLYGVPLDDSPYRVAIRFRDKPPIPVPSYASKGLSPDCPHPLRERWLEWLPERVRQGDMIGDLIDAINAYDKILPDLRSFAIMVPCLPMVAKRAGSGKKHDALVNRMVKGAKFSLPRLPEEVAKRVSDASSFFMAISMIDGLKSGDRGDCDIWMERATVYEYDRKKKHIFDGVFPGYAGAGMTI